MSISKRTGDFTEKNISEADNKFYKSPPCRSYLPARSLENNTRQPVCDRMAGAVLSLCSVSSDKHADEDDEQADGDDVTDEEVHGGEVSP